MTSFVRLQLKNNCNFVVLGEALISALGGCRVVLRVLSIIKRCLFDSFRNDVKGGDFDKTDC